MSFSRCHRMTLFNYCPQEYQLTVCFLCVFLCVCEHVNSCIPNAIFHAETFYMRCIIHIQIAFASCRALMCGLSKDKSSSMMLCDDAKIYAINLHRIDHKPFGEQYRCFQSTKSISKTYIYILLPCNCPMKTLDGYLASSRFFVVDDSAK